MQIHNLLTDTLVSFPELAKRIPPYRGHRTNASTIGRWAFRGSRDANGKRVKLGVVRVGGRFLTSLEEFTRFTERLSAGWDSDTEVPDFSTTMTPTAYRRASEAAMKRLKARGVSVTSQAHATTQKGIDSASDCRRLPLA